MITYNPAFDLYHCIFRMIHIIQRLDDNDCLEVDKIRIWDFYVLFPSKTYTIMIRRNEEDLKSWRKNNTSIKQKTHTSIMEIIESYLTDYVRIKWQH